MGEVPVAVPDFQTLMLPSLRALADGSARPVGDICEDVAAAMGVSEEDQRELLPSGTQPRFRNRVNWVLHYMKQACVLSTPSRGLYQITDRGRTLLAEGLARIDTSILERFDEFVEFMSKRSQTVSVNSAAADSDSTPLERLESAYEELRGRLAGELLEKLRDMDSFPFERVVLDVLVAMGYGGSAADNASMTARTRDGGIDGIIKEDKLGLDIVVVQAKQWANTVGEKEIREFAGSLESHRARKGVFITTAQFSGPARDYVNMIEKRIVLIDGVKLAELMMDHDVGATATRTIRLQRIDIDYFDQDVDL